MEYYIKNNGRVFGTFNADAVRDKIASGETTRETLVSRDKIEWKPAEEFDELFPNPQGSDVERLEAARQSLGDPSEGVSQQQFANPYAPFLQSYDEIDDSDVLVDWRARCDKIRKQYKGMWISLATGVACPVLFFMIVEVLDAAFDLAYDDPACALIFLLLLLTIGLTVAALVRFVSLTLRFLHSVWSAIPRSIARTTPVRAVGLCFIPIFNLYWQFVAIRGCAIDLNTALDAYASTLASSDGSQEKGNVEVALWFNILTFFPFLFPVQFVIWILVAESFKNSAIQVLALRGGASVEELRADLKTPDKNDALDDLANQR